MKYVRTPTCKIQSYAPFIQTNHAMFNKIQVLWVGSMLMLAVI